MRGTKRRPLHTTKHGVGGIGNLERDLRVNIAVAIPSSQQGTGALITQVQEQPLAQHGRMANLSCGRRKGACRSSSGDAASTSASTAADGRCSAVAFVATTISYGVPARFEHRVHDATKPHEGHCRTAAKDSVQCRLLIGGKPAIA